MNVDEIEGLEWKTGITLEPKDFKSLPRASSIMPQFLAKYFDSPCSSFFSFLPVAMWEKINYECNTYAHEKMRKSHKRHIAGYFWRQDISLQEMMQFMGLLIQMTLHPIPGRKFRYYWLESTMFPRVQRMAIHPSNRLGQYCTSTAPKAAPMARSRWTHWRKSGLSTPQFKK